MAIAILFSVGLMLLLALGAAYVLGWANVFFHVPVDPKAEACLAVLPGANCGGCGYVGCAEYAAAVATGKVEVTLCVPGGESCAHKLAAITGVSVVQTFPYRPVVHCAATYPDRLQRKPYRGEPTCNAANLIAGVQGCTYGCLGLSDCIRACNYDAIHVVNGLATVDYTKCVGCKACAKACPRNLITMVPFKAERMLVIACSNQDAGQAVKEVCTVGCIGCKACAKVNPELFAMKGNLPAFNYDKYDPEKSKPDLAALVDRCPRRSLVYVGKPSPEDLAAVKDEKLPTEVRADFKTTVDDTEWHG
jgi:electron transport complex protein RnfB